MMPAYITGIIWGSNFFNQKWIRYQVILSTVLHLLMSVEIIFYPVLIKSDDTWFGWQQLATKVQKIQSAHPGAFIFSADDYKTSAELNFYMDSMVYAQNVIGENALQFDFIGTDLNKLNGKEALFLDSDPGFNNDNKKNVIPVQLKTYFDSIVELDPVLIKNGGRTVRKFYVYNCSNYHYQPPITK